MPHGYLVHSNTIHLNNFVFQGYHISRITLYFYGTGSYPRVPNGLHRQNLFRNNQPPLYTPCLAIASFAYLEHVGAWRQTPREYGDIDTS